MAAHRGLDVILHVAEVQVEAGQCLAVQVHGDLRGAARFSDTHIDRARDLRDHVARFFGRGRQLVQVVAVELERDLAFLAGHVFLDVVADRLREVVIDAGDLLQCKAHLLD